MCKSSSFIRHKQKISVKSLHMGKIIRQLRKQEREKTKNGKKKTSYHHLVAAAGLNFLTAQTTKISC